MDSERLTIGKVACQAGVGVETVRFYERRGLMVQPSREGSNHREYSPENVARLRFIRRAKELGFSLAEIGELLAVRVSPGTTCADVLRRVQAKMAEIEGKIQSLRHIQDALRRITADCGSEVPASECPFLEALEQAEREE